MCRNVVRADGRSLFYFFIFSSSNLPQHPKPEQLSHLKRHEGFYFCLCLIFSDSFLVVTVTKGLLEILQMSPYESIRNKVRSHTKDLQGEKGKTKKTHSCNRLFLFCFFLFCFSVPCRCLDCHDFELAFFIVLVDRDASL